ncbi:MAG: class II fructose-bisphosphate aldolase, partial [Candidatus Omnitrophota bacterium]
MNKRLFFKAISGIITVVFFINSAATAAPLTKQESSLRGLAAGLDEQTSFDMAEKLSIVARHDTALYPRRGSTGEHTKTSSAGVVLAEQAATFAIGGKNSRMVVEQDILAAVKITDMKNIPEKSRNIIDGYQPILILEKVADGELRLLIGPNREPESDFVGHEMLFPKPGYSHGISVEEIEKLLKPENIFLTHIPADEQIASLRKFIQANKSSSAGAVIDEIFTGLTSRAPEARKSAVLEFQKNFPALADTIANYYEVLPVPGTSFLPVIRDRKAPIPAFNIDMAQLTALQIPTFLRAAVAMNAPVMVEVGPGALLTYSDEVPQLPEFLSKASLEVMDSGWKTPLAAVHLDHNQLTKIKVDDYVRLDAVGREKALQEPIRRVLEAIDNGFTSVALDLSTLMLLKEKDVWKRLEHVIYATARVYWAAAERAKELGIKISVEIEVGDIGKDISTAEEALALYAGTLEKLSELASIDDVTGRTLSSNIADARVKELLDTAKIIYMAAQLGSSHGYDINHNDMLEPYKGGVITEAQYKEGHKGYVIERAKEIIERFGIALEGVEIYIAYHGFSGFPIKIVPRLIDTGAGKVNINTDSQAEIWKILQAWFPDVYKELFIVSYKAAQGKNAKLFELISELHKDPEIAYSRAVKKPNSRIDVRNRIIFGKYGCPGARKLFRGAAGHALLEKLYQTFLRTDVKKRIMRDMFNKIRLVVTDDAENGLTALEALDKIGYKRFIDLYTALGLKDSADLIKVDRFSELRLQQWQLKDLREKAEAIANKSSSAGRSDIMPTGERARFLLDWLSAAVHDEEGAQTKKIAREGLIRAAGGKIQEAIAGLVLFRDAEYMKAVGSLDTIDKLRASEGLFTPGRDAYKALRDRGGALIAVNLVGYNQIEGHLNAATSEDAGIILEIARSQLDYAMDEKMALAFIRETAERIGYKNPLILHGDHIQYSEKLFKAKAILKEEYERVKGEGTFKDSIDIEDIDRVILEAVQARLKYNAKKERKAIEGFVERLIKAGFTSIAIDASTIYDEIAGEVVLNYYLNYGTKAEQLVAILEKNFMLSLEWGADFLKMSTLDQGDIKIFEQMKAKVAEDMEKRGKHQNEIGQATKYMEDAFGILYEKARVQDLAPNDVIAAYDKIMKELAEATITGKISEEVFSKMTEKQKLFLLPTNNAAETLHQLEHIDSMLHTHAPELLGHFGKEIEVGHVDRRVPNPRRGGKLEAKMTHPLAVKAMGEYITLKGQNFDIVATNNGSGHGTDFDKETLTPVSQVGKISPWLTKELQAEAGRFDAAIAQHGTSGSDMEELAVLAETGVIKFNIATNYQQIILNVLSLLDDGLSPDKVLKRSKADREALVNGLHKDTREKIRRLAEAFAINADAAILKGDDSLFAEHLKRAYAWGIKKGKIKAVSSKEDIATLLAKEFKRVFVEMNNKFYLLGHNAAAKSSSSGTFEEGKKAIFAA